MDKDDMLKHIEMDIKGIVFDQEMREQSISLSREYLTMYQTALSDTSDTNLARQVALDAMTAMFRGHDN
ncbi:hypothetical protein [Paucilactobacillus kaifaensis]|uniref:hypothetical protein n=1 Tax=Paucilactobacillus kaifaensis TaxID=2559921 RepID=UPI0010F9B037|nr:hypothetical protein [Paucilactobacillus kaifaensis]